MTWTFLSSMKRMFARFVAGAAVTLVAFGASARGVGYEIVSNEPDKDDSFLAANVYYATIGKNLVNYGVHAQGTHVLSQSLEIEGSGMYNLPGSKVGLMHAEGSIFLGFAWIDSGTIDLSSHEETTYKGTYKITNYIEIPDTQRDKFGLDVGGYFDSRGVNVYENTDPRTVTGLGVFAGLKRITQERYAARVEGRGIERSYFRFAWYLHVIRALTMGYSEDPTVKEQPSKALFGARFGFGGYLAGPTGGFMKLEMGTAPSVRGPDWIMFLCVGLSHSRQLF